MEFKFLAFTDLHYEPQVFAHDAASFLKTVMRRGETCGAAFAVQLGDFLHTPEKNRFLADVFHGGVLPVRDVFGNHDNDQEDYRYILDMYRLERGYYHFDEGGYRFIVLDPNYSYVGGILTHYGPGQMRSHHLGEIPEEQLEWLKETLGSSPYPCVLFSHQSIERTDGIKNRDDVWRIICEANRRRERSVILCVNGHYHDDSCVIMNGVCCLDLNSVSYYWCDVENSLYPKEIYEKFPISSHCLYYKEPLSAVVTLCGTGRIHIEGAGGDYICPVPRSELIRLDQRRLSMDRINVPVIRSYDVDLDSRTVEVSE